MSWILAKKLQDRTQMQILTDWGSGNNRITTYHDARQMKKLTIKEFFGRYKHNNPTEFFLILHKVRRL